MGTSTLDPQIADAVMDGIVNRAELARALKCSERTIIRLDPPAIRLRGRILYRVEAVRTWMIDQERTERAEPRRGRPAKRVA